MFKKILKKIKKFFKKKNKNKKKKKKNEEKIIEVIEDDIIVIDIVDSVLDELEFSSLESSISFPLSESLPSSLSFFSIGSLENDIKTMRYNELIDSIELP